MNFFMSKIEFNYIPQKLVFFSFNPSKIESYLNLLEVVMFLVNEYSLEAILYIKYAYPIIARIESAEFIAKLTFSQLRLLI